MKYFESLSPFICINSIRPSSFSVIVTNNYSGIYIDNAIGYKAAPIIPIILKTIILILSSVTGMYWTTVTINTLALDKRNALCMRSIKLISPSATRVI